MGNNANPGIPTSALSCCHTGLYLQHYLIWIHYAQANKQHLQIYSYLFPFILSSQTAAWRPSAPTQDTYTNTEPFFQTWQQDNESGKILGKECSFLVIHPISPTISESVLLALQTLSGYMLIMCTNINSICIIQTLSAESVGGCIC